MTGPGRGGYAACPGDGSWGEAVGPHSPPRSARLLDPGCELLDEVVHSPVLTDHARDLGGRVDHGGVVAAAELLPDLRQRRVGELPREVHRDLARVDDPLRPLVAAELVQRQPEALRRDL